ncbi:MAG: glycosyltransferase [Anaerolineae bacterium]|nr:glycosyltransferase [Candidatus Roseilinea sp.]MDW8352766.1 glycosyltransferase [Anaerolineae bacterium]MDW8448619.1 glycosyltransferase [Anaerolineae bacterium]
MTLRIVHIYKDYFPVLGGIENHIRQLAEAQAARGHQVEVLVTSLRAARAVEMLNGVRVTKAARHLNIQSAPIGFAFPVEVARLTSGADIAHLHAPYPIGEACNLWFGRAKRTVITWHSDIVRQRTLLRLYAPVLRRVIARADAIIPTSEIYARTSPWLRDHLDRCRVAPLGIAVARFGADDAERERRRAALRRQLLAAARMAAGEPLLLLSVGRLRYYKGLDDLIRAMPNLPDAVAVIVGVGPMEAEWKALAQRLGVSDRVIFAGEVSDELLPDYYYAADLYVIPANSRAEAFGVAILEAMAAGLPVISTEVGTATSWVNRHGVTGLVIPPRDPAAIAQAVGALGDAALRRTMGEAARRRVQAEFTLERTIARIEAIYAEVLATKPSRSHDSG